MPDECLVRKTAQEIDYNRKNGQSIVDALTDSGALETWVSRILGSAS